MKYASQVSFHTMESTDKQNLIHPPADEMKEVFVLCRDNHWAEILRRLEINPYIALTSIVMVNHISSTVLHQAITSRGNVESRALVIHKILAVTPQAASIRNGYGSLPLHVIAQRNTKIAARVKEQLIGLLVQAYPQALLEPGGVGKRTPLHIIFTDYISPRLTQVMIDHGAAACAMKDKKGWLPAHVACSRHCSPEKLHMLLSVHPEALFSLTEEGHTLLSLAQSTATQSHPNYALIDMLQRELERSSNNSNNNNRIRSDSPPYALVATTADAATTTSSPPYITAAVSLDMSPPPSSNQGTAVVASVMVAGGDGSGGGVTNRDLFLDPARASPSLSSSWTPDARYYGTPPRTKVRGSRPRVPKRTCQQLYDDPVRLLLHLSKSGKEGDHENNHETKHIEV